jgi:hypothetical protein
MPILVAIPYHENKRYCLNELFDWIKLADLPDTEVLMRFHRGVYGEKNAVKTQREFFRQEAIRLGASHLFFVGVDTIPSLDILPKLLARNVDVVGGVYYGRSGAENGLADGAVAWKHKTEGFNKRSNLEKMTGLVEVDGMGCDCLLLSKAAYESVNWMDWQQNDDDYPLFDKLKEKGCKIWLDTEVVCRHYYDVSKYN